jgi:hypothetical protein
LSTTDLSKVRNEILSAAAKWYDIGLELGLTADYLDTIKKANDDPQDCLRELLRRWLSGVDPQPSWKALIAALSTQAVNYHALASEIEQKYSSKSTGISVQSSCHPSTKNVTEPDILSGSADIEGVLPNHFPSARPTAKPRRQREGWKNDLIQSFEGIISCEVMPDQIEKAKQCIKRGGTRNERYKLLEFERLLNENQVSLYHLGGEGFGCTRAIVEMSEEVSKPFFAYSSYEPTIEPAHSRSK